MDYVICEGDCLGCEHSNEHEKFSECGIMCRGYVCVEAQVYTPKTKNKYKARITIIIEAENIDDALIEVHDSLSLGVSPQDVDIQQIKE